MIRRPPRSTPLYSSAASDVYKRQLHTHLHVHGYLLLFGAGSRCTPGPYLLHYRPQRHPRANQSRPQFIRRNLSISTSQQLLHPKTNPPDNPKPTASTHAEPENSPPKAVSTHTCLRFSPFALAGRIPTATPCLISTPSTFSNNHLVSNPTPRRSTENRGWPPLLTIASPSQTRRKDGGRRRANLRASPHVHAPLKRSDPYPGIPNVSRLLLTTRTRRPATARPIAHAEPDTPPPTTTTRSSLRTLILAEISLPIVSNPARSAHRARPASLLLADAESTEDLIHQILPQVFPCDASESRHTFSHVLGHQLVRPAGLQTLNSSAHVFIRLLHQVPVALCSQHRFFQIYAAGLSNHPLNHVLQLFQAFAVARRNQA